MVNAQSSPLGGADRRLQDLGIQLPAAPTPFGTYVETVQTGNLLFSSVIASLPYGMPVELDVVFEVA